MLPRSFKSLLEQLLEIGITRSIQPPEDLHVILRTISHSLHHRRKVFTIGILKGAASNPMFPPGEFDSMNPKSI
jgi:hypothetical protein